MLNFEVGMINKILEPEIKSTLINYLVRKRVFESDDSIINEFTVGDFSRRVDLALVKKNTLLAFEVKSEADNLSRLEGQTNKYLEYFDKVIVVTAPKHTKKALDMTPDNVAVWEVLGESIIIKRRGKLNKYHSKSKLIELMTLTELVKLARNLNIKSHNNKRRVLVESLLAAPCYRLRENAIECLKKRYKSTNEAFTKETNSRLTTPLDLGLLRLKPYDNQKASPLNVSSFIEALELA